MFTPGDNPVAQIVLNKIMTPEVQEVEILKTTQREGGFGSTNQVPLTLISHQELNQTLTTEDQLYLCMVSETGELWTNQNDPCIQPLLAEFQDVFPKELPAELPPKQDID